MGKVIRLNESDIERLVNKIIKEDGTNYNVHSQIVMNKVWEKLNELNDDNIFDLMELTFNEERMSVEDFVNNLPSYLGYDYDELVSILKQIKEEGI